MLPMIRKIINKHWNVFQINPKLQETFQNNLFVAFKRNKTLNMNLATQVNNHYVASRLLTLAHSEVTKHSNYTGPVKWISKWSGQGILESLVGHHGRTARKIFEFLTL